ncbi:MAG: site-2 protease family protein [Eubacteriales bacterium]
MKIKIHPLFYILFLFSYLIGEVKSTSLFFMAVFIHDISHFMVAKYYGVSIHEVVILPLGAQLKMNDDYLEDMQCINIYLAGPFMNIFISILLFSLKIYGFYFPLYNEIIFSHICIGFINLIPLYPMDGSVVLNILLSKLAGNIRASKIIITMTQMSGVVLIAITLYSVWNHLYNINFGIAGLFFIIQSRREGQNIVAKALKKELSKRKKIIGENQSIKCERICTNVDTKLKELMGTFHAKKYYIIEIIDTNYNYITMLTEEDILNGIINLGYDCTIKDILVK